MSESHDDDDQSLSEPPTTDTPPTTTSSKNDWKHSSHENDAKSKYGDNERDVVGYGANPVKPHWPRSAKVALNFVINYEEGGEMCLLHGDDASECLLSDNGPNTQPYGTQRISDGPKNLLRDMHERCGLINTHFDVFVV